MSDTHGLFDPLLPELFRGCDLLVHAGDVVGHHVLDALRPIAPLVVVAGNNDVGPHRVGLPLVATFAAGGLKGLVIHELKKPSKQDPAARKAIAAHRPDVVVYGHSHVPHAEILEGILYVNPGSAGKRRFSLPRCAAILEVVGRDYELSFADLAADLAPLETPRRSAGRIPALPAKEEAALDPEIGAASKKRRKSED